MNIHSIFKDSYPWWKTQTGLFGVEIETECKSHKDYPKEFEVAWSSPSTEIDPLGNSHTCWPKVPLGMWKAVEDGSLRDFGVEYVLRTPLSYKNTLIALDEFKDKMKDVKFLKDTASTSVHVHINMLNETPLTLANVLTLWTMFENPLIEFCGPSRRSNFFAAPIRTTEGIKDNFVKLVTMLESGQQSAVNWSDQGVKYAALNIATLQKFGSMEIRSFRGTTDTTEIAEWVSILNKLYLYAKKPGLTPASLLDDYRVLGQSLLFKVFEEHGYKLAYDTLVPMLERNECYVLDIVQAVKNWDTLGLAYVKPKPEKKLLKAPSQWGTQPTTFNIGELLTVSTAQGTVDELPDEETPY
jgi:hypothetical protein